MELINWTNQVRQKIQTSGTVNVACLIEIKHQQPHATILYPQETDLDLALSNLNLYCATHEVQALVCALIDLDGKLLFFRKLPGEDFTQF